nr:hypothetical protein Q903MT_gene3079 [Picea sitchensis]
MNLSTVHHRTLPLIALREYEGSFWVIESKYMWLTRNNITTICYHCYCSCSHCKREEELPEKILYVFLHMVGNTRPITITYKHQQHQLYLSFLWSLAYHLKHGFIYILVIER